MCWQNVDRETVFTDVDSHGNRYLSQFLSDYKKAFPASDPNAGCRKCLNDYYEKLTKHISTMGQVENKSGYVLKAKFEGIPLEFGSQILVTNSNMTKEYAEKLLKRKHGADLFEIIPEASEEEDFSSFSRKKLDAKASELGLNPKDYANKAEIAEAIQKAISESESDNPEDETINPEGSDEE